MRHALVRRDTRMIDDPQRFQASPLGLGLVLAVVGIAGSLVLSLILPAGRIGDAKIVTDKQTGALYVRIDDRLYPVTDPASARLIIGSPDNTVTVNSSEISKYPSGPLVGIPGAPRGIQDRDYSESVWTVCDVVSPRPAAPVPEDPDASLAPLVTTVAFAGRVTRGPAIDALAGREARLVTHEGTTWLIFVRPDGVVVRSPVALDNPAVADALGLNAEIEVSPISHGLFNAIPAESPLGIPLIPNVGAPPRFPADPSLAVGDIVTTRGFEHDAKYFVTLDAGIEPVSETAATMVIDSALTTLVEVDRSDLARYPRVNSLRLDYYPRSAVHVVPAASAPVICWSWSNSRHGSEAEVVVLSGSDLPLGPGQEASMVDQVGAMDSQGRTADRIGMDPNVGRLVQAAGAGQEVRRWDDFFWVAPNGVRFGLDTNGDRTNGTLAALSLQIAMPAPWAVLSLFSGGPTLSRDNALLLHGGTIPQDRIVTTLDSEPGP